MRDEPILPYKNGVVLKGYDVVQYHYLKPYDKGVIGDSNYKVKILNKNAIYEFHFINQKNKDKFLSDPVKYIPGFGGFCLFGLAYEWNNQKQFKNILKNTDNYSSVFNNKLQFESHWNWTKYIMGPPSGVNHGWLKYEGKIYFNYSNYYTKLCLENMEETLKTAKKRWKYYYSSDLGPLNIDSWGENTPMGWQHNNKLYTTQENDIINNDLYNIVEAFKLEGRTDRLKKDFLKLLNS